MGRDDDDRKNVRSDSLRTWCHEAGGEFYEQREGRRGGYYGCQIDDQKIEVTRRPSRKNLISVKSEGMHRRMGLASESDLVEGPPEAVETTEGTIVRTHDGIEVEPPRTSKRSERSERTTYERR